VAIQLLKMKTRVCCIHLGIVSGALAISFLDCDNERLIKHWLIGFAIP
jgi:hypothetical protein